MTQEEIRALVNLPPKVEEEPQPETDATFESARWVESRQDNQTTENHGK